MRAGSRPYPPELQGGIEGVLDERGHEVDRWFLAVRTIFAVGLVGFLSIDLIQSDHPTTLVGTVLIGYVVANVSTWMVAGLRTNRARWIYMIIDVAIVVLARQLFQFGMVVDANAAMAGVFSLLLLTYTVYGDPRLTLVLAGAAFLATIGSVAVDLIEGPVRNPGLYAYAAQPVRGVLLACYLGASCLLTIGLSRRLRSHVVDHGMELIKRVEATVTAGIERSRREKVEELDRLKRDFISILSHELRTPLTPLRSSLDLMRGHGREPASELLEIALESTHKLQRLVLDYTQLAELLTEKSRGPARWNVELGSFMDVLCGGMRLCAVRTAGLEDLHASVDPKLLAAGLLALLRRAQLVSTASPVTLCGFSHGTGVTLSVHDPESYIDRDLSEILDDPFGPSNERTFTSPNTGLELILARYALQRTGGTLRVTSTERKGTTAICTVPGENPGLEWLSRSQIEYELEPLLLHHRMGAQRHSVR